MILSTRGWGREEFANASSDFLEAARWAVFSGYVGPMLAQLESIQNQPMDGLSGSPKLVLARQKREADKAIPVLKAVLYPEDEERG